VVTNSISIFLSFFFFFLSFFFFFLEIRRHVSKVLHYTVSSSFYNCYVWLRKQFFRQADTEENRQSVAATIVAKLRSLTIASLRPPDSPTFSLPPSGAHFLALSFVYLSLCRDCPDDPIYTEYYAGSVSLFLTLLTSLKLLLPL
jgi:hypothetical protein